MLGFTFSFPGLSMQMHLISKYNASPAEITAWFGIVSLPWFFKPIYGIISDSCPMGCTNSNKYHRRPYITLGLVFTSLLWIFLYINYDNMNVERTMLVVSLESLFLCISDVAADGLMVYVVKREDGDKRGRLQTLVWSTRAVGGIVATYTGYHVQTFFGTRAVYLASAVMPFITAIIIWKCPESPAKMSTHITGLVQNLKHTCTGIWDTMESAKYLVIFCFVFSATPSYDTTLFVFLQQKLKYTMIQLAELGIISSFFGLLGTLFFYYSIKKINPKWAIFWGVLVQSIVRLSLLIVVVNPNHSIGNPTSLALLYGENSAMAFLSQFTQMPLLILAAHACKEPFEAACYATVLSVSNFGGATSSLFGASITRHLHISATPENWSGLPSLIEICIGTMVFPLILLFLLPIDFTIPTNKETPEIELPYNRILNNTEIAERETETIEL